MLADSLSGSAKVMMFMHVAPEGAFMGESVSTLNFGSKVAAVTLGQVCDLLGVGGGVQGRMHLFPSEMGWTAACVQFLSRPQVCNSIVQPEGAT
eukprot:256517-Chlamydomonas_euryale.AAC.9